MNYQGIGFVFIFAWDIFFHDDNDENEILKIARVHRYAEEMVPRFSDQTFKMHFRITPNTFERLLEKLYNIEDNNNIQSTCWEILYRTCKNLLKINIRYKLYCGQVENAH